MESSFTKTQRIFRINKNQGDLKQKYFKNIQFYQIKMIEFWELIPPTCFPIYKFRILYFYSALGCDIPILESLIFHLPFEQVQDSPTYQRQIDKLVLRFIRHQLCPNDIFVDSSFLIESIMPKSTLILDKRPIWSTQGTYIKLERWTAGGGHRESKDDLSIVIEENNITLVGRRYYIEELSTFSEFAFHLSKQFGDWLQIFTNHQLLNNKV